MAKFYSRVLGFANLKQPSNTQCVPKKTEKLRVLILKCALLRRISRAFLASGLVRDGNLLDDPWSGELISGGLDTRTFFPKVFIPPQVLRMVIDRNLHISKHDV